eukprot:COSAG04_NODE_19716_length_409_cov_1.664516_1_plen_127_part_10
MREGLAVCEGYAKLLCAMCDAVGVHCKLIGGQGRGGGADDREAEPHGWNALSFDGRRWHLCDVCWAAGHSCAPASAGSTQTRQRSDSLTRASSGAFIRCFNKDWWCTEPRHFVGRHLPDDAGDQLLK